MSTPEKIEPIERYDHVIGILEKTKISLIEACDFVAPVEGMANDWSKLMGLVDGIDQLAQHFEGSRTDLKRGKQKS